MVKQAAEEIKNSILNIFNMDTQHERSQMDGFIDDVKYQMKDQNRSDKIKICAMFGGVLSIQQLYNKFKVSMRVAQIASTLYKTKPILSDPPRKRMKGLSEEVVETVKKFYKSDECSKVIPDINKVIQLKNTDRYSINT